MADLRRLMKERAASKRIEHPYARYNNSGSLSCSLCSLAIKSEVLWPSHLTSKVHRSNVKKERDAQEATQSASNGKRAASANEDEEMDQDGQQDRQKRVRIDESAASNEATASTSSLPPGFFDNPVDAPNDQVMPAQEDEEDPEWAAFEATLAEEQPQASTSTSLAGANASSYASATISAGEVLYANGADDEKVQDENGAEEEEEENDEPKETEEERRDREEREELMERIETEEREQQEADERVDSLKKRLSAIRASKKAGSSNSSSRNGGVQVNGESEQKEALSEARQRRNRRLRGNA